MTSGPPPTIRSPRRRWPPRPPGLRDHPSVISFLIGSDFAPDARIEKTYLDALKAADWRTPVVAAASDNSSPVSGSSGMKMTGPYDWIPPGYWYAKREGGATGFNSETSAGPDIPTLDTLRRMMTPAELATPLEGPGRQAVPPLPVTGLQHPQALRQRPHRPLRPADEPDRLRPQGPARPVRERARPVRGVRAQRHRCLEAGDRRRLLDVQQRLDLTALAVDGPLPRPGRSPTSARRRRTNRCTSSTPTTTARSSW
ncbi:hypothetical protein ACRAWF_02740 [Streptomyces sp. L7]